MPVSPDRTDGVCDAMVWCDVHAKYAENGMNCNETYLPYDQNLNSLLTDCPDSCMLSRYAFLIKPQAGLERERMHAWYGLVWYPVLSSLGKVPYSMVWYGILSYLVLSFSRVSTYLGRYVRYQLHQLHPIPFHPRYLIGFRPSAIQPWMKSNSNQYQRLRSMHSACTASHLTALQLIP